MIWVVIAFLVGGFFGILLMAMMFVAKRDDDAMENYSAHSADRHYPWERKGYLPVGRQVEGREVNGEYE